MYFARILSLVGLYIWPLLLHSQNTTQSQMAFVEGVITDFEENLKVGEIIVFENIKTKQVFETISNDEGEFEVDLPYSSTYQIKIKGFGEDVDYTQFSIPALEEGQNRLNYQINIKFKPATSFTLNNVHFESGKATLTIESYKQLKDLLEFMKLKKLAKIEVAGHTDNVGDDEANLVLSTKRAEAVRNYLISNGVAADRVIAEGYGEKFPVDSNVTAQGRQANRRTEVRLLE